MDYSKYKELKITQKDRILTITINRPDDMNAVNEQLHADFSTIFLDAEYDDDIDIQRTVDGVSKNGPVTQFKSVLGLGISFSMQNYVDEKK